MVDGGASVRGGGPSGHTRPPAPEEAAAPRGRVDSSV